MRFDFSFKSRSPRFYLGFVSSLLAIVASIIFFVFDRIVINGNISFTNHTVLSFLMILLGGVVGLVECFSNLSFLSIVSSILYGVGVGRHLADACYPIADMVEGVHFFCNSEELARKLSLMYILFLVLYVLILAAAIVLSFLPIQEKKEAEAK